MKRCSDGSRGYLAVLGRLQRRPHVITALLALLAFGIILLHSQGSSRTYMPLSWKSGCNGRTSKAYEGTHSSSGDRYIDLGPLDLPKRLEAVSHRQPSLRVAVLEHAGFHDEVIGAVLKTLEDINMNYTVYRDGWRWGYESILDAFLPHTPKRINRGQFANDVKKRLYEVVIHVSCDYSWRDRMPDYIATALAESDYLHVICIQHELENLKSRERDVWAGAVKEKRFSLMTLSPHTTSHLGKTVQKWAVETGNISWGNVGVDTLVPVFPMNLSASPPWSLPYQSKDSDRKPSKIAILGNIHLHRRNYQGIIRELSEKLQADPEAWGYEAATTPGGAYVPMNDPALPALTLHLVGSLPTNTKLDIPEYMEHMIEIHPDLEYSDFYRLIASMDLIVPAFRDFVYVDLKLSSAIPAAIISGVPILATPLLLSGYSFLRPPALILHPSGMSEISAIGLLRQGVDPMSYLPGIPLLLPSTAPEPVDGMSIARDHALEAAEQRFHGHGLVLRTIDGQWDRYHQTLYEANAMMMRRLLLDIEARRETDAVNES